MFEMLLMVLLLAAILPIALLYVIIEYAVGILVCLISAVVLIFDELLG